MKAKAYTQVYEDHEFDKDVLIVHNDQVLPSKVKHGKVEILMHLDEWRPSLVWHFKYKDWIMEGDQAWRFKWRSQSCKEEEKIFLFFGINCFKIILFLHGQ